MLLIRQALRTGMRLLYTQCFVQHCSLALYKPIGIIGFHHDRFVHQEVSDKRKELGKLEGKMKLLFTCKKCNTRNSKIISKLAYHKGVIIVRCDGCKNNHLIADNLGWFTDMHKGVNIERLMASKGESVRKIANDVEGYFEIVANEEFNLCRKEFNTTNNSNNDEPDPKADKTELLKES